MGSAIQSSPGIVTREIDLTNFVSNVGASGGAMVGQFSWGAVEDYTVIDNTNEMIATFGKPTEANYADWYSASNFLAYTSGLNIIRVVDATAKNATGDGLGALIKNEQHYYNVISANPTYEFASKYPGVMGDNIQVSIADANTFATWAYKDDFDFAPGTSEFAASVGGSNDEIHLVIVDSKGNFTGVPGAVLEKYSFLSKASDAKSLDGAPMFYGNILNKQSKYVWYISVPLTASYVTGSKVTAINVTAGGSGYTSAPTVVITGTGTGATATAVLGTGADSDKVVSVLVTAGGEGYSAVPAITFTGGAGTLAAATAVIVAHPSGVWATTCNSTAFKSLKVDGTNAYLKTLTGADDGAIVSSNELITGWNMFKNSEQVDVSLLFTGTGGEMGQAGSNKVVIQHVIDNIAEHRKDCVVYFSPNLADVQNLTQEQATENIVAFRDLIARSSSYAVMDSGWKLQYDVFNDKYRWIPMNADVAGLCAATDTQYDPWWSPGGFNRGKLKNVVSLAFNPNKSNRDSLYKVNVNPIVTFTGDGTVLYGDKTLQAKASAFAWINVRRLFIVLEKAISRAAKYQLFEFNDTFTRAQFTAIVEPYLRDVKGRRGVYDFRVICDETNNTPEVIDRGEFVANIFIKPSRSINFITLNFVATRTGVDFNEIVGSV